MKKQENVFGVDLQELAIQLAPLIAHRLLVTPTVCGDNKRIKVAPGLGLNNTIFNSTSGDIRVEEDVCFGHNVCLLAGTHNIQKKGRERITAYPVVGHDIIIRKGVWLASNVTIIGPCEIGENSVIAAGSLVNKDVPPNCLYAGSPAKLIKEIQFDE